MEIHFSSFSEREHFLCCHISSSHARDAQDTFFSLFISSHASLLMLLSSLGFTQLKANEVVWYSSMAAAKGRRLLGHRQRTLCGTASSNGRHVCVGSPCLLHGHGNNGIWALLGVICTIDCITVRSIELELPLFHQKQ